jgi:hypothetical protein
MTNNHQRSAHTPSSQVILATPFATPFSPVAVALTARNLSSLPKAQWSVTRPTQCTDERTCTGPMPMSSDPSGGKLSVLVGSIFRSMAVRGYA